jgi:hypothetical protein
MLKKIKKSEISLVYDEDGNKVGVVLPESTFETLIDELEEVYDWMLIQKRSKLKGKLYTHEEIVAETLERMRKK